VSVDTSMEGSNYVDNYVGSLICVYTSMECLRLICGHFFEVIDMCKYFFCMVWYL